MSEGEVKKKKKRSFRFSFLVTMVRSSDVCNLKQISVVPAILTVMKS